MGFAALNPSYVLPVQKFLKPMMPVEPRRRFVDRIDRQREHRGIGADRTRNGVE